MSKKKTMNQPVRCIVYLSTVRDLQYVNQREQRQLNYISDYAKGNNIEIVKVMRRNVLGQLDVNRHFDQLVQMISEGFADGIFIANMQFVPKEVDDVCRKIAKVSNMGGAVYSVDDGRLAFRFKEVCRGNKSR